MGRSKIKKRSPTSSPAVAPGGPPIQVTRSTEGDRGTDFFSEKFCITCNMGNRSFSLELTQKGIMDRVLGVEMKIEEKVEGKASANLTVTAIVHQANGASCLMTSEFSGGIKVHKGKICSPSIPDAESLMYVFNDPESQSFFNLEKKINAEFEEMITATHCFSIGEDAYYYVAIKIVASNRGAGLRVKVEGPAKRTYSFVVQLFIEVFGNARDNVIEQFVNGVFSGSADEDMKLIQASGSYVNTGIQSQMGLINSSGFFTGIGNGGIFNNCRISSTK